MTIVCVDTNWFVLHGLKKKVKKCMPGADVHMCRSVKDALAVVRQHGCDILITEIDLGAEKEEGIELARKVKDSNPVVNIIFATSGFAKDYAQQLVRIRYSGFLTKPFNGDELSEELKDLRYG